MRTRKIVRGVMWTGLLVLHVEDVENLNAYVKAGAFSLSECLLFAAKRGDPGRNRLFGFADLLRDFVESKGIKSVPTNDYNSKFDEVLRAC
jgi:hypothetical protein